jgi:hypothetical protein
MKLVALTKLLALALMCVAATAIAAQPAMSRLDKLQSLQGQAFARSTLPTLQEHRMMAMSLPGSAH